MGYHARIIYINNNNNNTFPSPDHFDKYAPHTPQCSGRTHSCLKTERISPKEGVHGRGSSDVHGVAVANKTNIIILNKNNQTYTIILINNNKPHITNAESPRSSSRGG